MGFRWNRRLKIRCYEKYQVKMFSKEGIPNLYIGKQIKYTTKSSLSS